MKRRLLVPIVTAGMALASGVASAQTNAHTLEYFRNYGLLLEVSADPRDGSDFVQTNPTRAGKLELVALNDSVRLRGMTVQFSDGRTFSQPLRTIGVGERVMVDLPANCGLIQSVRLDYGRQIVDRTPARLQIIPHDEQRFTQPTYPRNDRWSRYQQPSHRTYSSRPTYQQPSYVVRPAPQPSWSALGTIQGSFRF
ncbi:MAG TPA: hypothetical protein VFV99_24475 [Kofleriaceae bacterium]|nr:hypothetical protein [Kofleriaceae bacterium]